MDSTSEIQIGKLFLADTHYGKSIADIYIGGPTAGGDTQTIFILADLPRAIPQSKNIIDAVVEHVAKSFERSRRLTPELTLESVLEALNIYLPTIGQEQTRNWLEHLNVLIGVSDRGQVHFAHSGDVQVFHIHRNTLQLISQRNRIENPLKVFSQITSGLLEPGDAMLFTTNALVDYVSGDKIKFAIRDFYPSRAVAKLASTIVSVPSSVTFAAVVIKFCTESDELAERREEMENRLRTSDTIEPLSRPSVTMNEDEPLPRSADFPSYRRRMKSNTGSEFVRALVKAFSTYCALVWRIVRSFVRMLFLAVQAIIIPRHRALYEALLLRATRERIIKFRNRWEKLSVMRRSMLGILLAALVVLLNGIVIRGQERQATTVADAFEEILVTVSTLQQDANDASIYRDERKAEELLVHIHELLASSIPTSKEQEAERAQYLEENARALNKIRHINYVVDPLMIADFGTIDEELTGILASDADTLLVTGQKAVYAVTGGSVRKRADAPAPLRTALRGDGGTFLVALDGSIYRLGDAVTPVDLQKHQDQQQLSAVSAYGNNLYILDGQRGAIFRYEYRSQSFRNASVWLNAATVLNGASSLAVDGNVYVISTQGQILKYFRGSPQDFNYHAVNPAFGSRTEIITRSESNNLYFLDPDNNRIAIMDKQGNIRDQFTSPKFTELRGISMNEKEDTLFVLAGSGIYGLAIK